MAEAISDARLAEIEGRANRGCRCDDHDCVAEFVQLVDEDVPALLAEVKQLRAERSATAALADELQDAELRDRAARSEWEGAREAWPADFAAHAELDRQLNESQARLCAAQDAWTAAAVRYRTIQPDAAPQQPEGGDRG